MKGLKRDSTVNLTGTGKQENEMSHIKREFYRLQEETNFQDELDNDNYYSAWADQQQQEDQQNQDEEATTRSD